MSLGKRRNHDYWGLVKQIGPHPQTKQDLKNTSSDLGTGTTSMGKGGTEHSGHGSYESEIRPYQLNGRLPPPKMSKWAQRSVVNKPLDVNMRKPVPGKKFGSLPSLLKGIAQTLNGIAGRGADQGTVSSTPAEVNTNILNQDAQSDMPGLMVETPTSTTAAQPLPDVVQIPRSVFGTQTEGVGASEVGIQTDQRPAGVFNSSQTDITMNDISTAERRYVEARAELARRTAEREELLARINDLQTRFEGSVQDRVALDERYQNALRRLANEIPLLEEHRDLAEAEIQRLRDEVNRPPYTPQTSSIGLQVTAPPSYGPQLSTTGVQAGRVPRDRSPEMPESRQRRRTIADVVEARTTADRQTSVGGSFVNSPGQLLQREGAANRGRGSNRNSINTQTPQAISVNPGAATRASTRSSRSRD